MSFVPRTLLSFCAPPVLRTHLAAPRWQCARHILMTGKKYYAISRGKNGYKGIVHSWAECERQVKGISSALFKKFSTLSEAREFVAGNTSVSKLPKRKKSGGITKRQPKALSSPASPETAENALKVYTDGACSGNGKKSARAGYGVFFGESCEYNVSERLPGRPTNQRAEMTAVLVAMRVAHEKKLVSASKGLLIFTDSSYTLKGITQWVIGWKRNGWRTSGGTDVKNRDLWEKLDAYKSRYESEGIGFGLRWVKGHSSDPGNEAADRLAVEGAGKPLKDD